MGCAVGRGAPASPLMHGSGLNPAEAYTLFSYILDELILLIGYLAVPDGEGRSHFSGWRNGVMMLEQLCSLPLSYFISPRLREVLLPTLVLATYKNKHLLTVMRRDVSTVMVSKVSIAHTAAPVCISEERHVCVSEWEGKRGMHKASKSWSNVFCIFCMALLLSTQNRQHGQLTLPSHTSPVCRPPHPAGVAQGRRGGGGFLLLRGPCSPLVKAASALGPVPVPPCQSLPAHSVGSSRRVVRKVWGQHGQGVRRTRGCGAGAWAGCKCGAGCGGVAPLLYPWG